MRKMTILQLFTSKTKQGKSARSLVSAQDGFTMIELLIVITILGILATAVLSAINPIEQINRGRDTGSQSDAEQLLSGIDRYNAFQGYYPWQADADETDTSVAASYDETADDGVDLDGDGETNNADVAVPMVVSATSPYVENTTDGGDDGAGVYDEGGETIDEDDCAMLHRLANGEEYDDGCNGAQEVKESFVNRLSEESTRSLYVYNSGTPGASTYVCFVPQSGAFEEKANNRCEDAAGTGLPDDIGTGAAGFICNPEVDRDGDGSADNAPMHCLP
jgi:prepilin-type N-terminal cleavage/methylation domain-containing protein